MARRIKCLCTEVVGDDVEASLEISIRNHLDLSDWRGRVPAPGIGTTDSKNCNVRRGTYSCFFEVCHIRSDISVQDSAAACLSYSDGDSLLVIKYFCT